MAVGVGFHCKIMVLSWHMRNGAAETERGFSIRKEVVADIWIVLTLLPECLPFSSVASVNARFPFCSSISLVG